MNHYAFVIHHKCSYVDGMIIITAENLEQAIDILKKATWKDGCRPYEEPHFPAYPIIKKQDIVLDHYPKEIQSELGDVWCLYHTFSDGSDNEAGVKAFSYHNG